MDNSKLSRAEVPVGFGPAQHVFKDQIILNCDDFHALYFPPINTRAKSALTTHDIQIRPALGL